MTVPLNYIPENSFSINRIISSRSDCLAVEEQHQIVYLDRGAIRCSERDQRSVIRDRHLLLIPPGRGEHLQVAALSRFYQICLRGTFWELPRLFDTGWIQVFHLPEELASRIQFTLSQMLEEFRDKSSGYERMICLKMAELDLLIERTLPRICVQEPDSGAATLDEVVGYIQSHYNEEFSLSFLARLCGLTPSYFSRVFTVKTGTPVFEYINHIRIQKACTLLKRSDMTVIEIALAVGYNNISFFNRYFRKLNGMSPRDYRTYIRR